jgi:hypothetical protein
MTALANLNANLIVQHSSDNFNWDFPMYKTRMLRPITRCKAGC